MSRISIREELVIWARKKTGVPIIRISSDAEASHFLKKHSMFVVGLFEKFEVLTLNSLVPETSCLFSFCFFWHLVDTYNFFVSV